jgi:hypothetical protein
VIIGVWSVPPPSMSLPLFPLVHGIEGEAVPGHSELLPVLWDMGILPEIRVLPGAFDPPGPLPQTPDEAVRGLLQSFERADDDGARERLLTRFDSLFRKTEQGYVETWRPFSRQMLVTWEPSGG